MKNRLLFAIVGGILIGSCAHRVIQAPDVFISPQSYLGRTVAACGFIQDGSTIRLRRNEIVQGLNIVDRGPVKPLFRGSICLIGKIEYNGCKKQNICTDWAYDYGIRISRELRCELRCELR